MRKYIVYLTDNLVNQKIYVGKHTTETPYEFDGYWGTSEYLKNAIEKYGREKFKRYTLFVFDTEEEAYTKEAEIVDIDFVNRKDTYNLKTGGEGGCRHSEDSKQKMRENHYDQTGENHPFYRKHHSEDTKQKMSIAKSGEKCHWYGKHHSEDSKQKMSIAKSGEKCHWYGKHHSDETKQKMSISKSGENNPKGMLGKHHSPETIQKISESLKVSKEIIKQRREDIKNIEKVRGYKTKLARKWNKKDTSTVTRFIKNYAQDLV